MNGIIVVCNHPEGIKPTCRCGANASCPICGYGHGAYPCDCSRVDMAVGKYKERFAEAWKALA
jgi:hypothetical protein